MKFSSGTISQLKALAGREEKDEYTAESGMPEELVEALREQEEAERKQHFAQIAVTLRDMLKEVKEKKRKNVEAIRRHRAEISRMQAEMDKLDEAVQNATKTHNYLPVAHLLDPQLIKEYDHLLSLDDVTVPSQEKKKTVKTSSR